MPTSVAVQLLKEVARPVFNAAQLVKHRVQWRHRNGHNNTHAANWFPISQVSVGNHSYGALNVHFFGHPDEAVHIGALCSIANDVHLVAGGEHPMDRPTTFPLNHYFADRADIGSAPRGPIRIGDDVWIGRGTLILSGVTIGQGAVIGAGSVVAKDVPPYAIFAGGRVVRFRFDEPTIERLSKLDWHQLGSSELTKNLGLLTAKVEDSFFNSSFYRDHLGQD